MSFSIQKVDITTLNVDAIVNAANENLYMGGGVCGAIFKKAGAKELQAECNVLSPIKTGEAVITRGFHLPARYIIHAVGPVYSQHSPEESERLLTAAYKNSLKVALQYQCKSIAFPLISGGIYGYPKKEAIKVAISSIKDVLKEGDLKVILTIFDDDTLALAKEIMG